jgi:hypothetical protein
MTPGNTRCKYVPCKGTRNTFGIRADQLPNLEQSNEETRLITDDILAMLGDQLSQPFYALVAKRFVSCVRHGDIGMPEPFRPHHSPRSWPPPARVAGSAPPVSPPYLTINTLRLHNSVAPSELVAFHWPGCSKSSTMAASVASIGMPMRVSKSAAATRQARARPAIAIMLYL